MLMRVRLRVMCVTVCAPPHREGVGSSHLLPGQPHWHHTQVPPTNHRGKGQGKGEGQEEGEGEGEVKVSVDEGET